MRRLAQGQLPYIVDDARASPIPPSSARISRANTASIRRPAQPAGRAQAWVRTDDRASRYWGWSCALGRSDNFAKGPSHFFDAAPEHMRGKNFARTRNSACRELSS